MADTKTSALPAASTPLADSDLAYVVQSGNSRQTTVGDLRGSPRDYGPSATDPTTPAPADGDRYYSTAIDLPMVYDAGRAKWLSEGESVVQFGRNGNTGAGAYYRGASGRAFGAASGRRAEYNGTVTSLTYTRIDTDAATFEVTASGGSLATLASAATSGTTTALNADFAAGDILGVRNQSRGNATRNVHGFVRLRWRA